MLVLEPEESKWKSQICSLREKRTNRRNRLQHFSAALCSHLWQRKRGVKWMWWNQGRDSGLQGILQAKAWRDVGCKMRGPQTMDLLNLYCFQLAVGIGGSGNDSAKQNLPSKSPSAWIKASARGLFTFTILFEGGKGARSWECTSVLACLLPVFKTLTWTNVYTFCFNVES